MRAWASTLRRRAGRAFFTGGFLLTALLAGCGRNEAGRLLVPTGIRPAPEVPTGGLTGFVYFDSTAYPGLGSAPLPPARLQLLSGGAVVSELITAQDDRSFTFGRLRPGNYLVRATSHAFYPLSIGPFRVVDKVRDAGDLRLIASQADSLESVVYLMGTMPGFDSTAVANFTNYCDAFTQGRWTYPNVLFDQVSVPAGTHRLKFITDASSKPSHLIGWGGDGITPLTVPVRGATARFGTDAATDLVVTFPSAGNYDFVFDERRLTIDITPTPAAIVRAPRAQSAGSPPSSRRIR